MLLNLSGPKGGVFTAELKNTPVDGMLIVVDKTKTNQAYKGKPIIGTQMIALIKNIVCYNEAETYPF